MIQYHCQQTNNRQPNQEIITISLIHQYFFLTDFFSIFRGYILSVTNIWLLISALLHILSPNILVRFIPLHSVVLLLLVIVLLRGWHLILLLLLIAILLLLLLLLVIHWLAIGVRLIVGLSKLILWIRGLLVSKALLSFSFNSGIHIAIWILNWGSTTTSISEGIMNIVNNFINF